jgi:hypothetical protein
MKHRVVTLLVLYRSVPRQDIEFCGLSPMIDHDQIIMTNAADHLRQRFPRYLHVPISLFRQPQGLPYQTPHGL